ncbi:hypothetical protein ACFOU2_08770 [Bacillus songklensis]|uniref:Uncharacterized protein n=1 Tax=Bacillus songklensis TaxID=1069116 RepID=A0ABV8B308_9BACI
MRKMKKIRVVICILIVLPILLSLDSIAYDSNYYAKYRSPEGILFLSYTKEWDEQKLKELYGELIKNKHGQEISLLQEVRVRGGYSDYDIRGRYQALTNTITLYHGDSYTEPSSFRETLSHEYGHHFAYYYFKSHHFPFSKWANLRGLRNEPVRWDAFWNYSGDHHKWFPEEIIADDYVLLYGPTEKVDLKDVYSNEAFYLRTEHENQDIPNVLENKELHQYLEKVSGLKIDKDRLLKTPIVKKVRDDTLSFSVTPKTDVAYRLNLSFYEQQEDSYSEEGYYEMTVITSDHEGNEIVFPLEDSINEVASVPFNGYIKASVDVLDLNTSIGFQTDDFTIKVHDNHLVGTSALNGQK